MKIPTHAAVFWWKPAAWLRVSGGDAATFLQGQFTNDLGKPPLGGAVYGLWLNVKGKVVADSFVLRGATADEFWIASYFSPGSIIRERLEAFVIADDVVIEDAGDGWSAVTVFGEGAASLLPADAQGGFRFAGRRSIGEVIEWIFPASQGEAVRARFAGLTELSGDEVARRRIEAGIPAVPADLGPNDLPNEGGLEAEAISYTKGCYLGQEVMARLKSMGRVRRRLERVAVMAGEMPRLPAPLFDGPRQVGELRSAARTEGGPAIGLAMVSLLNVAPGAKLGLSPAAATEVTVLNSA
jgi:folate-binding protein YgfZ